MYTYSAGDRKRGRGPRKNTQRMHMSTVHGEPCPRSDWEISYAALGPGVTEHAGWSRSILNVAWESMTCKDETELRLV